MTLNNTGGQPGSARPPSPELSRRSRQGLTVVGVIAAIALSFYLLNSGVATSQNSGGTPAASPIASPAADDPRIMIDFIELNDSGVTGTATLYASGSETVVELDLEGTGEDHPAHIHEGTCDDIQPEPEYNLDNAGEEGTSTSVVDVPLVELIEGDYVIDLHLAANQLGTLIVCAEIEGEPTNASGTPVAVGGQGDPTAAATATEAVTLEPTATQAPTLAPTAAPTVAPTATQAPTLAPTAAPTVAPAETPAPTATLVPTQEATAAPESTPDDPTDSIGGLISDITAVGGDGTQGSSSMLDSGKGGPVTTTSGKGGATTGTGDGTQGGATTQSGKGGNTGNGGVTTTTGQLSSTGTGSSLIFPETPHQAAITALSAFSAILFGAALMLRRAETRYAASRWRRLGF